MNPLGGEVVPVILPVQRPAAPQSDQQGPPEHSAESAGSTHPSVLFTSGLMERRPFIIVITEDGRRGGLNGRCSRSILIDWKRRGYNVPDCWLY